MVALSAWTEVRRHRFTAEDYERMAGAGILTEDDRVELIAGEIIEMSPIGDRHVGAVNRLTRLLSRVVGDDALVSVQNPIRLATDSQPQPDLAVVRGGVRGIADAADVLLVIEVADTSREYDRGTKLPLYAAAGIAEAWLVDLVAGTIERHTEPRDGRYRLIVLAGRGESVASTVLPAITLPVDAIIE